MPNYNDFGKSVLDSIIDDPGITEKELIAKLKSNRDRVRYYLRRFVGWNMIKKDPPVKSGGIMYYYPLVNRVETHQELSKNEDDK
jgi:predicted transcriptional regulator